MSHYFIPGSYRFRSHDVVKDGQNILLALLLHQYLIELLDAAVASVKNANLPETERGWLRNSDSFTCCFMRDGKAIAPDPNERARGFNFDLKSKLGVATEAGGHRYRLSGTYVEPKFGDLLFTNPEIDFRILRRLERTLGRHE